MTQAGEGTLLAGKYRLESLIGRGGMGSVWRAEHLRLNAPVAVKLLAVLDFTHNPETLNRFHREARAAAAIRSPHVVQIFDHGVDETIGVPFIVMELMEGESLAQRLTRSVRISPAEVARVFTHVARALSRAHEAGIVHRDLKPDNVFLVRNEDEEVAKVLDFGIAKAQAHGLAIDSATRTGAVMGTAYYMSPEQISGSKNVDFGTDLWAFGVMACECLTGQRPFDAETIGGLTLRICVEPIPAPSSFAAVPMGFDDWFARIVNRDPTQRFSSAREAADALRQLCTGEGAWQPVASTPLEPNGFAQASAAPTGGPISRSAADLASPSNRSGVAPWLFGVAAVAVVAGALWLRVKASRTSEAAATSATSPVVAAPTDALGTVPAATASAANREPNAAPSASAAASLALTAATPIVKPGRGHLTSSAMPAARNALTAAKKPPALASAPVPAASNEAPRPTKPATARDLLDDR